MTPDLSRSAFRAAAAPKLLRRIKGVLLYEHVCANRRAHLEAHMQKNIKYYHPGQGHSCPNYRKNTSFFIGVLASNDPFRLEPAIKSFKDLSFKG